MVSRQRQQIRLSAEKYQGCRIYFITITTAKRKSIFRAERIVSDHLDILCQVVEKHGFEVIAYCFMPDHLHLLLAGRSPGSNLIALIKEYKQRTGFAYKQEYGDFLWQKSFYDHVLRSQETISMVAQYILDNPVRCQLVEQPSDYPYSGSLVYGRDIFLWLVD